MLGYSPIGRMPIGGRGYLAPEEPPTSTVTGVSVLPATATVTSGALQQFEAVVAGTNGPSQAVTWTAAAGSISTSGLFRAPAAIGTEQTIVVTATSQQDGAFSGTATVTVPVAPAGAPLGGFATARHSRTRVHSR